MENKDAGIPPCKKCKTRNPKFERIGYTVSGKSLKQVICTFCGHCSKSNFTSANGPSAKDLKGSPPVRFGSQFPSRSKPVVAAEAYLTR